MLDIFDVATVLCAAPVRPTKSAMRFPAYCSLSLAFLLLIPVVHGQSADDVYKKIEPFLDRHCTDCHDDAEAKGGLDLYALAYKPNDPANFEAWQHIFDRVKHGEMPPKKKKQPSAEDKKAFLAELQKSLMGVDRQQIKTVSKTFTKPGVNHWK